MSAVSNRSPYDGPKRKLVIAFDVGTTFSGISYAILDPGRVPEIRGVTQFPGQENVGGDCKIPTILYYDALGRLQAAGAEAKDEAIEERAADEGWVKAEWFKLHLRPNTRANAHLTGKIPPLPSGKTVVALYADFIRYLHKCVRSYIEERHANGADIWRTLQQDAHYVITHPNGWEGAQQTELRRAAILAGLFADNAAGQARLSFLTEGEASLHFCVRSDLTTEAITGGKSILIVDAGGGTIDISAYKFTPSSGYEETAVPQCHLQGSIMVTTRAQEYLTNYLANSLFSQDAKYIADCFDQNTKHVFRNVEDIQYIRFGSPNDRDDAYNIRRGQLKLPGGQVALFFKPSVDCIIKSITQQVESASSDIRSVFLVGGFAANTYLFGRVRDAFSMQGIDVCRPDPNRVNKAVADGAVSFHLDHLVTARMTRFDYGIDVIVSYNPFDVDHRTRASTIYTDCIGCPHIPGGFTKILAKDIPVTEVQTFKAPFVHKSLSRGSLNHIKIPIRCYRGRVADIQWLDEDPSMFHTLCQVSANTSSLSRALPGKIHTDPSGERLMYYELDFEVVLTVGRTELTAHIAWMENGVEKISPAKLIYDVGAVIPAPSD